MAAVKEVCKNIFCLDDKLYSIPGAGSVYLISENKKVLIDTGPATSAETVLAGIRQAGFQPEDIDLIIITHIHLDHSGGVGTLLKSMPKAGVIAHRRAIRHLVDPSRLVSSAVDAQGREFVAGNGNVLPVEETRLIPAHDGDTIDLGNGQGLTLLDCPGHAPHEICIFEGRSRGIFVGDAVGHYIEGTDVMVPITPPPGFDLELYLKTLDRLKNLDAARIYFSHSGVSIQAREKLELAANKLQEREGVIAKAAMENNLENAGDILTRHICGELEWVKQNMKPLYNYWASVDIPMSAAEHVRYYKKKHGL